MLSMIWMSLLVLLLRADARSWPIAAYKWQDVGTLGLQLYGSDFLDVDSACRDDVARHEATIQVLYLPRVAGARFRLIRSYNCPGAPVYVAKLREKKLRLYGLFRTVPDSFVVIGSKLGFRWLESDSASMGVVITAMNDSDYFQYRPSMMLRRDNDGAVGPADSLCCDASRKRVIQDSLWQKVLDCNFVRSLNMPLYCETPGSFRSMCGDLYSPCGGP